MWLTDVSATLQVSLLDTVGERCEDVNAADETSEFALLRKARKECRNLGRPHPKPKTL